jgi:tetratricopeptide (TPR) repeat protein
VLVAPVALVVVLVLAVFTNLRIIQADVTFKLADPLSRNGQWDAAIALYDRSNEFAFAEDYYYLFLGKAYLDSASAITNPAQQDKQVERAETSLKRAQTINPLNTDHTANLARLYRWWATRADDNTLRKERGGISSAYYDRALTLSPHNAALWGEWASLYLGVLRQPEEAYEKLTQALEIDPDFETTHALLGDYYIRISQRDVSEEEKTAALEQAAYHYSQAVENIRANTGQTRQAKYNYIVAAGGAYVELGDLEAAIQMYRQAVDDAPAKAEIWRVEEVIASLYLRLGDRDNALAFASSAEVKAPDTEKGRLQNLITQLQANP